MKRADPLLELRRALYWAKEAALKRNTRQMMRQIEGDAALTPEARRRKQWSALQEVVRKAARDVPLYRELWGGVDIEAALTSPDAFSASIPILERETLVDAGERIIAEGSRGTIKVGSTSGSSNSVLRFRSDVRRAGASCAARAFARRRLGLEPGMREFRIRSQPWRAVQDRRARWSTWANRALLRAMGIRDVSAVTRGPGDLDRICRQIRRFAPEILYGLGTALMTLADFIVREGRQDDVASVKTVIYVGSSIHQSGWRLVEGAFGSSPIADYACREMGMLAYGCPAGGIHLNDDMLYFEMVDDVGQPVKKGPGHLVVTDLTPSSTPYIRYRLGDICELASPDAVCACGAPQRILSWYAGRKDNRIRRRDGTYLEPGTYASMMLPLGNVLHWQVHLGAGRCLRLQVECPAETLAPVHDMILVRLQDVAGADFVCSVEAVDRIEPMPNGKYARVVREPGWDKEA